MINTIMMLLALQAPDEGRTPEGIEQLRIETAHTLKQGGIELELVGSFLRFDEDPVDVDEFKAVAEIEYGITDRLMAEIEFVYLALNPERGGNERGWGDMELETKYRLPWTPWDTVLALGTEVSIPTGDEDEGLGGRNPEFGVFGVASRRFDSLAVHVHGGVEVEEEKKPEYEFKAAADWTPWGDELSLMLGVDGEFEPGEGPEWSLIPGFEVRFEDEEGGEEEGEMEIEVGVGIPIGLSDEAQDWGVIVNIEIEF